MTTDEGPAAEVLAVGPHRPGRLLVVLGVLVLVLILVALGAVAGWRIYRARTDLISAQELRTTYGAFLTPDGRNMVTELRFSRAAADPLAGEVDPSRCAPLFEATFGQHEPAGAVGGVSTFQGGGYGLSVSLFSFRFPDRASARAEFARLSDTAAMCNHQQLVLGEPFDLRGSLSLNPLQVPDSEQALDVWYRTSPTELYQETMVQSKNVVSWEYSYRSGPAQQPEHQLLTALSTRLHAVDRVGG